MSKIQYPYLLYNFSHIFRSWDTLFHQFSPARLSTWKTFPQHRPLSFFSLLLNAEFLTPAPSLPPFPPIASSIPFSIQCPRRHREPLYRGVEPEARGRSAFSFDRRADAVSRSDIDGPSTLCRNFSSRHRLLHYKSPLRKIDATRGSPPFQRCFGFSNLVNWYVKRTVVFVFSEYLSRRVIIYRSKVSTVN